MRASDALLFVTYTKHDIARQYNRIIIMLITLIWTTKREVADRTSFHVIYRCAIQKNGDMSRFETFTVCNTLHHGNL